MNLDPLNTTREHAQELAVFCGGSMANRNAASRSLAQMAEARELTRSELDERRLIHRHAAARGSADAFREIRTRLLDLGRGGNFVTQVASVSPGSGSSFVARNLAAAFALDEAKSALLIDCNLRYPSQRAALKIDAEHGGLIDYLEHPDRSIQQILYHTGIPRVRLIPAGDPRESSGEYFSSFRMRGLIVSLRSRYADRYLILDGPALKGSPDARILSDLADFVVIVAAYGRDSAADIEQAVAGLDQKKLAGVVFNHPP